MAFSNPIHETVLAWRAAAVAGNQQVRPFADPLLHTDHVTGARVAGLATSWSLGPAATTWTFKLRQDIPFHDDWGIFSSKDVPHSLAFILQPNALSSDAGLWRNLVGETQEEMRERLFLPDDETVVFNLKRPEVQIETIVSNSDGTLYMYSKDQWDAEGLEGYERKPAGTGPWEFVDRRIGQWVLYSATENHWRKTPEFKELQYFWAPEPATRLAMILTEEADISEVDRLLHSQAQAKGMEVVNSRVPSILIGFFMGGLYHPDLPNYDPDVPYLDVRVRQAVNLAINRKEYMNALFGFEGEPGPVVGFHSSMAGWNPEWQAMFQEKYPYDPERARQLLADAGFPDGFKTKILVIGWPGVPETVPGAEVMGQYLKEIGIDSELESMEFARFRTEFRAKNLHNTIVPMRVSRLDPVVAARVLNYSGGVLHLYEDPEIDRIYETLVSSIDPEERNNLLMQIGNIKFNNYAEVPIAWIPAQLLRNPKTVAEYIFPGNITGFFTHFEYAKPAQ